MRLLPKSDDFKYSVIVSTGRTGTKFLSGFLNSFEKVYAVHEPTQSHQLVGKGKYFSRLFEKERRNHLIKAALNRSKIFIESDSNLRFILKDILSFKSHVKCIHVIRDPKDFVRSFASRRLIHNEKEIAKYSLPDSLNHLPVNVPSQVLGVNWEKLDAIQRGSWVWNEENRRILGAIKNNPNAITVKFEDLFLEAEGIKSLLKFLDIVSSRKENSRLSLSKNETKKFLAPSYEDWSQEQKLFFSEVTGNLASQFSYSSRL